MCKDKSSLRSPPLLPRSIQPSAFGSCSYHTYAIVQVYAWVDILVAKRGNACRRGQCFDCPGIPLLPLVLKQPALESAQQWCWRNRPSRKTEENKGSVWSAGSYPVAQPCHRTAWLGTRLALQIVLSLVLHIQSNWAVPEQSGSQLPQKANIIWR